MHTPGISQVALYPRSEIDRSDQISEIDAAGELQARIALWGSQGSGWWRSTVFMKGLSNRFLGGSVLLLSERDSFTLRGEIATFPFSLDFTSHKELVFIVCVALHAEWRFPHAAFIAIYRYESNIQLRQIALRHMALRLHTYRRQDRRKAGG
jgi:hypothetical protein